MELKAGRLVRSLAGHDEGEVLADKSPRIEQFNNEDIAFAIRLYKKMVTDTGKETNV